LSGFVYCTAFWRGKYGIMVGEQSVYVLAPQIKNIGLGFCKKGFVSK
tara:strand:+ start:164 stop:304 length:141 start_codon:yes stop_codon:yes gene_type:complete